MLTENGELWGWGLNGNGQIGINRSFDTHNPVPQKVNIATSRVKHITCGFNHSLALTEDGKVFSWGNNQCGQLGRNSSDFIKDIEFPNNAKISQLSSGYSHCIALSDDGKVFTWGNNQCGQLGQSDNVIRYSPTELKFNFFGKVIDVMASSNNCFVITDFGIVYGWGDNSYSQLTLPITKVEEISYPILINIFDIIPWTQYTNTFPIAVENLQNDFLNLLNDNEKDISIVIQGTEFKFHTFMIEARCPSLLTIDKLKLERYSSLCFEHLIKYIYSDKIDLEDCDTLFELRSLANALNFKSLVDTLSFIIMRNFRNNVVQTINNCEEYKCDDILTWISWYFSSVKDTDIPKEVLAKLEKMDKSVLQISNYPLPSNHSSFTSDMERLLEKNDGNFKLIIGDLSFNLHKPILKCRSVFFNSIFHVRWNGTNIEELEHETPLSPKSFQELLRFIYTGKLESFHDKMVTEEIMTHIGFYCIDNDYIIKHCEKVIEQIKYEQII